MDDNENLFPIPMDLTIEILLRLPVKAIARCRCVSKLWSSMLRRPDFTELFLTKSSAHPQLLFVFQKKCDDNNTSLFFSNPEVQNPYGNSAKFAFHGAPLKFCGHVRGLTCVTYKRILNGRKETVQVICNPSTGRSFTLPKMRMCSFEGESFFGYDPIAKLFKVLSLTSSTSRYRFALSGDHQVLTLGTRRLDWRLIECSMLHRGASYNKVCINGSLYYQANPSYEGDSLIVCFDVRLETLRVINKPEDVAEPHRLTLVNCKGRLGAFVSTGLVDGQSTYLQLWVLVDAEKHEWSKHIYELPPLWQNVVGEASLNFVGVTGTNEVVLSSHYYTNPFYVFYYHIESKTIRRVEVQGMDKHEDCILGISLDHIEDVRLMQISSTNRLEIL